MANLTARIYGTKEDLDNWPSALATTQTVLQRLLYAVIAWMVDILYICLAPPAGGLVKLQVPLDVCEL